MKTAKSREPLWLLAAALAGLAVSGFHPHDRLVWLLEVLPVLIGLPLLVFTHRRFPLTRLAYRLLLVHAFILMVGGHYTYARVPPGDWLRELFSLSRNHYDRLGHLAQGFVPAIVVREVLLRRSPLTQGKWLYFLTVAVCLAISAGYELIEWGVAVSGSQAAGDFLGSQGDVWDTQWDMFCALIGANLALMTLGRLHDRQLAALDSS